MYSRLTGILMALMLGWCVPASGADNAATADARYRLSGSYKNLALVSRTPFLEERFWSDLNRLRLALDADLSERVTFHAVLDNEWLFGTVLDRQEFQLVKDHETDSLIDLNAQVLDRDDVLWRASLYRMHFDFNLPQAKLVLGRQRIAWGSGRIWNPVDLFNPISPLAIEPDQRDGVDAVNLEYYPGAFSLLNIVYAAGGERRDDSFGVRAGTQFAGYDVKLMAGEFRRDVVAGLEFAGSVGSSGVRGELTYTDADAGGDFWRAVAGWDHSFPSTLYLMFEYLYNGGNVDNPLGPGGFTLDDNPRVFTSGIATRNRNFLGAAAAYELTPLLQASALLVYDIDDASSFVAPSLVYSVLEDLDLTLGAQLFSGDDTSEYGDQQQVYYASLEWFF